MPTSSDSKKLTIYYLQKLFTERTDNTHYVRMPEIIDYLADKEIYVDRRTIYSDLKLLDYAGFHIEGVKEKGGYKYHHKDKLFSLNELKFLVDAVGVSRFMTEKKSIELISKVKSLASIFEQKSLNRNMIIGKRIKSMSDVVLKNLDVIHSAIATDSKVSFQYMRWTPERKAEMSRKGEMIVMNPFSVALNGDYYYLLVYDEKADKVRHYRVDKIKSIKIIDERRVGIDVYRSFNISDYVLKTFSMYGGYEETVSIDANNYLANAIIDRFGDAVSIRKSFDDPDRFVARVTVNVSPQFFAWIVGLGKGVVITSPNRVKQEFIEYLDSIRKRYS